MVCDVFARYHRQKGNDVLLVSGADAHGTPVTVKAQKEGLPPDKLAEKYSKSFLETFKKLNTQWDIFTTTESQNHKEIAQNLFKVMYENKDIYPKEVEQYYDPKAKQFLADRYIEGTCPYCGNTKARGDQCNDGCERTLDPSDLKNPKSKLTGEKPILKKHTVLFFDLPRFDKQIRELVKNSKNVWRERVIGFAQSWLKEGLRERAVSRKIGYGVDIPIEKYKDQDIYVWFEAVMGYLSASIEWASKSKDPSKWEHFWKNPKAKHFYFIAKDNIPFHTILWPAIIIAYNKKYKNGKYEPSLPGETRAEPLNLPYNIPANQFLTERGTKISKSKGTLLEADLLLDQYGTDLVRYFFCKYAPENHDRKFTYKDIVDLNNNELVATFGNFINRNLYFVFSKLDGIIEEKLTISTEVKNAIDKSIKGVGDLIEKCEFSKATDSFIELAQFGNKYFDRNQPWATLKSDPQKCSQTIYDCIQIIKALAITSRPFMPEISDKIFRLLNIEYEDEGWKFEELKNIKIKEKPEVLFNKIDPVTENVKTVDYSNFELVQNENLKKDIPITWTIIKNLNIKRQSSTLKKWMEEKQKELIKKYEKQDISAIPENKAYREQHDMYSKEKNLPAASEKLTELLLEKGNIPNINTFVDLYNIFSIESGITFGAHDMSKIVGNVKLVMLKEDQEFTQMGNDEKMTAKKGEYCYIDDKGVICRLTVKQCDRTKITTDTKDILVILQGNSQIDKKKIEEKLKEFKKLVENLL